MDFIKDKGNKNMNQKFIKGMELCQKFYNEIVADIIKSIYPDIKYSAGLINHGSEVLGFDDITSTDHDWGPRVTLFFDKHDLEYIKSSLQSALNDKLPKSFMGYPISISLSSGDELNHRITLTTAEDFFNDYLGYDITNELTAKDWLIFSEQKLKTIRNGKLFKDDLNIESIRQRLHFYPDDVWLYIMACDWQKIGQEEHLAGRCGSFGDELGSAVLAARLVHIMMHLCFMMEREYAPYSKWFGTAFSELECGDKLMPVFMDIIKADNWNDRESYLIIAYELTAKKHNELCITKPVADKAVNFFTRNYKVIQGGNFMEALLNEVSDEGIKRLKLSGSVNQLTTVVDVLESNEILDKLSILYED